MAKLGMEKTADQVEREKQIELFRQELAAKAEAEKQ